MTRRWYARKCEQRVCRQIIFYVEEEQAPAAGRDVGWPNIQPDGRIPDKGTDIVCLACGEFQRGMDRRDFERVEAVPSAVEEAQRAFAARPA